jgi:hypothetical protein
MPAAWVVLLALVACMMGRVVSAIECSEFDSHRNTVRIMFLDESPDLALVCGSEPRVEKCLFNTLVAFWNELNNKQCVHVHDGQVHATDANAWTYVMQWAVDGTSGKLLTAENGGRPRHLEPLLYAFLVRLDTLWMEHVKERMTALVRFATGLMRVSPLDVVSTLDTEFSLVDHTLRTLQRSIGFWRIMGYGSPVCFKSRGGSIVHHLISAYYMRSHYRMGRHFYDALRALIVGVPEFHRQCSRRTYGTRLRAGTGNILEGSSSARPNTDLAYGAPPLEPPVDFLYQTILDWLLLEMVKMPLLPRPVIFFEHNILPMVTLFNAAEVDQRLAFDRFKREVSIATVDHPDPDDPLRMLPANPQSTYILEVVAIFEQWLTLWSRRAWSPRAPMTNEFRREARTLLLALPYLPAPDGVDLTDLGQMMIRELAYSRGLSGPTDVFLPIPRQIAK